MNSITLHRIKKSASTGAFYVSERYRIRTDQNLNVPSDYRIKGVHSDDRYVKWMDNEVIPVIEQHMGDIVIDRWAVTTGEDPYHITIAMSVNDTVTHVDMLQNTTSFNTPWPEEVRIANELMDAVMQSH